MKKKGPKLPASANLSLVIQRKDRSWPSSLSSPSCWHREVRLAAERQNQLLPRPQPAPRPQEGASGSKLPLQGNPQAAGATPPGAAGTRRGHSTADFCRNEESVCSQVQTPRRPPHPHSATSQSVTKGGSTAASIELVVTLAVAVCLALSTEATS